MTPFDPKLPLAELKFVTLADSKTTKLSQAVRELGADLTVVEMGRANPSPEPSREIANFANRILTADIDTLIFVSGAGVKRIFDQALKTVPRQRFLDCVSDIATVAGSAQAAEELRRFGVEPNVEIQAAHGSPAVSWRAILMALDQQLSVVNQSVSIEQTVDVHTLSNGLEVRGARVTEIAPFTFGAVEDASELDALFGRIDAGDFHGILLSTPEAAARFLHLVKAAGRSRWTSHLLDNHLVLCLGPATAEILSHQNITADFVTDSGNVSRGATQIANEIEQIKQLKSIIRITMSGPATSTADPQAPWYNNPFMKACRGEPTDVTPIWMMRQAGRYMAEYRAVRDKISFLDLCANPQLCSEVMCTAVNRLGVDAAIIFSDLLPILVPMGCDLEFVKGDGPVIHNPVRTTADLDRIKPLASNEPLQFVMDTVKQTRNDLPADMPLIGFAGAPFTLASYMIEGGSSRNYANTKKLMYGDRGGWDQLMEHLTVSISMYLAGQIEAGAQCVQLFDSWAGCLNFEDYREYVLPYVKKIIASIPTSVPVINFATGNPALLPLLADTRAAVIGIDWRVRLDTAWETVGHDRAVQGNLDPTVLLTDPTEIKRQAKIVLDQAGGRSGHIFNLGHGILPMTPVDNAIALVDAVHELSAR